MTDTEQKVFVAIVSAILGLIVGLVLWRIQRTRRRIEYVWTSIPLFDFEPGKSSALQITVPAVSLGHDDNSGARVEVQSAVAVAVRLSNSGNTVVEDFTSRIVLNSEASIIEYRLEPSPTPEYAPVVDRDRNKRNEIAFRLPYLNTEKSFHINLLVADIRGDAKCDITVVGKDLHASPPKWWRGAAFVVVLLLAPTLVLLALSGGMSNAHSWGGDAVLNWLGGTTATKVISTYPPVVKLFTTLILGGAFAVALIATMVMTMRGVIDRKHPWGRSKTSID